MKKVYAMTIAVAISGGLMAQIQVQRPTKRITPKMPTPSGMLPAVLKSGSCVLAEDFEATTVSALVSAGWDIGPQVEQQDDNTGTGLGTFVDAWYIGDAAVANTGGYFPVPDIPPGNLFIMANDDPDPCNCDLIDVNLTTPSMDFTGLTAMSVGFRIYSDENFGGGPTVLQASSDGGTTFTDVLTISASTAWQGLVADLSAFDGMPDVKLRWHWSDGGTGNWATGIAVDDICVNQILPNNLAVNDVFTEDVTQDVFDESVRSLQYTMLPLEQAGPMNVGAAVVNNGGLAQTNVVLTAEILLDGNPVGTYSSSPVATSAPSQVDTIIVSTGYTPTAPGTITVNVTVSADQTDDDMSNNTGSKAMEITGTALADGSNAWARDNNAAGSFFANGTDGYTIGNVFEVTETNSMCYGIGVVFGTSDDGLVVHSELLDANLDLVEESGDHETNASEYNSVGGNNFTYIPLQTPVSLDAGADYVGVLNHFGGGSVRVAASGTPPAQTSFFYDYTDDTWYYLLATPMVRMFLGNAVGVPELESTNGVSLGVNMPNPFNGNTSIQYSLSATHHVSFEVVDVNGKVVFSQDMGAKPAGTHLIDFNASDLANGLYSYTLTADQTRLTRRMMVNNR
ncbi:MAG: T9SS type A sorting domain-containing protein [Flavobacteriales bacterium]|nr:T9SS type A sorting domain-containing protein [Flavobacteriales bacterium]